MSDTALSLVDIRKSFVMGETVLDVLAGASLEVSAGEVVALLGPSGSGKSTLLHIAGLLETANSGAVIIGGRQCNDMSDAERTQTRRQTVGFVYQFHNLLPEFTAAENVALPCQINGMNKEQATSRAIELLSRLGLAERLQHNPSQLSGGEQQRVAIARGLANRPSVLLADEPTGNLDEGTSGMVFDELLAVARDEGVAALIATHNSALAARMDRRIVLHNGCIERG